MGSPSRYRSCTCFYNGLVMGAFVGLYATRGMTLEVLAWILPHGVTEILAVLLCGAAGLRLGTAAAFPGDLSRWDHVKVQMRRIGPMVIGAVVMFFIAALIEGFFRQLVQSVNVRWVVAGTTAVFWLVYFSLVGRK
ncbi:MAG: stage II sporulation protein M [bacterium]